MHKTALEMYRDAYNLHYKLGDTEKAKKIYHEIIEGYPVSDAADYASIQLKNLDDNINIIGSTESVSNKKTGIGPLVVSIMTLVITITILVFGIFHIRRTELKLKNMSDLSMAQNKIMIGNQDEALLILSELKIKNEENLLPFVMASDIYIDRNDFKKARHELQTFQRLNPGNADIKAYLKRLDDKEALYIVEKKKKEKEKETPFVKKAKPIRSRLYKEPEPKVRRVKKDEISYF